MESVSIPVDMPTLWSATWWTARQARLANQSQPTREAFRTEPHLSERSRHAVAAEQVSREPNMSEAGTEHHVGA